MLKKCWYHCAVEKIGKHFITGSFSFHVNPFSCRFEAKNTSGATVQRTSKEMEVNTTKITI